MSKKHSEIYKRSPRSSSTDYQENSKTKYGKTESDQYRERSRSPVGRETEYGSLRKISSNAPRIRDEENRFKNTQTSSKSSSNTDKSWDEKYSTSAQDIGHSDTPPPPTISDDPLDGTSDAVPTPPPPPRISKITMGFSKTTFAKPSAIKMNLAAPKVQVPAPTKVNVASVFNDDSDDEEPEEMPPEARMRMRNIGRETPTSAGPNSFGKTKHGFCDSKKVFERNLKQSLESSDPKQPSKFPQTVYKINNS